MDSNLRDQMVFKQPRTFEERKALARVLVERLNYKVPLAIDSIDGRADRSFSAWPERIYVLAQGGKVLYKAKPGPFGFDPAEAEKAIPKS
jgi:type I thyroxine 5'-deiodinase